MTWDSRMRAGRKVRSWLRYAAALLVFAGYTGARAAGSDAVRGGASGHPSSEELSAARAAYYAGLDGDKASDALARQRFAALAREHPNDATLRAYLGSLVLLDAAHTWSLTRKHALSVEGVQAMDTAVNADPNALEARFVRALTTWHLPFYFHRKEVAEEDLRFLGSRAEEAARTGALPSFIAAAALDYWGQVLAEHAQPDQARNAFLAAARVDKDSPAGADALKRLR